MHRVGGYGSPQCCSPRQKAEQARQQITDINLKFLDRGMVAAAIEESSIAGNSMNRAKQVTDIQSSREQMSVLGNYQRLSTKTLT